MNATLRRRVLRLSYFTVGYNVLEGILSVAAGLFAGSVALIVLIGVSIYHVLAESLILNAALP